jgi:hypothetical protein
VPFLAYGYCKPNLLISIMPLHYFLVPQGTFFIPHI